MKPSTVNVPISMREMFEEERQRFQSAINIDAISAMNVGLREIERFNRTNQSYAVEMARSRETHQDIEEWKTKLSETLAEVEALKNRVASLEERLVKAREHATKQNERITQIELNQKG